MRDATTNPVASGGTKYPIICLTSLFFGTVMLIGSYCQKEPFLAPTVEPEKLQVHVLEPSQQSRSTTVKGNNYVQIITQLSGEMGNNLHSIACSVGLQSMLKEKHNVKSEIKIRHQDNKKWQRGQLDIAQCFPKMADWNFSFANTDEFLHVHKTQQELMERLKIEEPKGSKIADWTVYFGKVAEITSPLKFSGNASSDILIPHILQDHAGLVRPLVNRYLPDIRKMFKFNKKDCCKEKARDDEAVFHFRNFLGELKADKKGFKEELSANKTANELFAHLKPGERVAITTRFEDATARSYVDALERRGLKVRVISGQTGPEDFCFLMSAKKELVGSPISKFFMWAALLGDAKRVRSYAVDSPARREGVTSRVYSKELEMDEAAFRPKKFIHPDLVDRFFNELYESEEMDTSNMVKAPRELIGNPFLAKNVYIRG